MTPGSSQPEKQSSVIEELTAYLDGELEPEALQLVEQRLVADPSYLAEMQSLQRTWDLLDAVPTTEPGVSFTQTTMEMVVGEATQDARQRPKRSWVWPTRVAVLITVPIALFATAFALTRGFQTESDRLLVQDLSVIENYPKYTVVENNVEFLNQLVLRGLFSDSSAIFVEMYNPRAADGVPDSPEERKQFITSLDIEQKAELKKKLDDYLKLANDEIDGFRAFDEQIHSDERKADLMSVLNSYYDWLRTIGSTERARLMDLSVDKRIAEIARIRDDQAREEFGRTELPTVGDRDLLFRWAETPIWLKEKQIREHFPIAYSEIAKAPPQLAERVARKGTLPALLAFLLRYDRDFVADLILEDSNMYMLYRALSPKAQAMLDDRTADERRELVLTWVESANQSKNDVPWETLRTFEKSLSVKERAELDKLSIEGYREALKAKYREAHKFRARKIPDEPENWRDFFEFDEVPDFR